MEIFQANVCLGVLTAELLDVATHMVETHGVDRRHANAAGHLLVERADLVFDRLVGRQDLAAALVKHLALGRGHQRPLRPLDELHAQSVLELANHLAGPRLGDAVVFGRPGKAPPGNDVAEDLERLEVHEKQQKIEAWGQSFRLAPDKKTK